MTYKEILSHLQHQHKVEIIEIQPGDQHCKANGEENYRENSCIAGPTIYLGLYEDVELKLISLFHELGHRLLPEDFWKTCGENTLLLELECWRLGILAAQEIEVHFSDRAVQWGYNKALSYCGHDQRERSNWRETCGTKLWISKLSQ